MTKSTTQITIPTEAFRRIASPLDAEGKRTYFAAILAKDLSKDFEEWQEINPRVPDMTSGVAKKISVSLENEPENFFFKNRGLTLSVGLAVFDNAKNELHIELSDKSIHGLIDGSHTYSAIMETFGDLTEQQKEDTNLNEAYVKFEILEGFTSKDEIDKIVSARNTSIYAEDKSMADLVESFDFIKETLKSEPYADRIAYSDAELKIGRAHV